MTTKLKGTNVASAIVPFTDNDKYATHYALFGKGGFRSVSTLEELNSISNDRKEEGMICYVINDPNKIHTYQLLNGKWNKFESEVVEVLNTASDLEKRKDLEKDAKLVYISSTSDLLYYSTKEKKWKVPNNVKIQTTEPNIDDVLWIDEKGKSIEEYKNEDLVSIHNAINELTKLVQKHEYAFNNVMSPGSFTDNVRNKLVSAATPEKPDGAPDPIKDNEITEENDPNGPEYPEFADGVFPNIGHLCIKMGSRALMEENAKKGCFVDGELLYCSDKNMLCIMTKGRAVWINRNFSSEGGGGSLDYEALDKLKTIGFETPEGNIYRVKVNNGGSLIIYKKENDSEQPEPTGSSQEGDWTYVTTLYLQKLYINSVYCGGLIANEHSYNPCSHNYVELSNLTDKDITLNGLSLQYCSEGTKWEVLPLWGTIKKQSTFLIRGAQCGVMNSNTTRIKVKTYDMEWWITNSEGNKELIKFNDIKAKFYLTWGTKPSIKACPFEEISSGNSTSVKVSKGYIDFVGLQKENASSTDEVDGKERKSYNYLSKDRLFTKYYAMDPVTQATKDLKKRDNSKDWYFIDLKKDVIPNVLSYTPKASFENKNIFYNKSLLDPTKPNLIFMTFGIQATAPNATKCFNWVSVGYYDEFLWYKKKESSAWIKVESFKNETGIRKYYNRIRMETTDGTSFTTHKVIIKNLSAGDYDYKIGRADSNGQPDKNYISDILKFKVVNATDNFTFVQTTDQQGFNWDEYQVWKISADYIKENVSPIDFVINTGDLTQNGNRINEWIDYYDGRKALEDKEEMITVGNNDLCPSNIYSLGNGKGDSSKINSSNISYFFTYEIDESNPPIFNVEGKEIFVNSLYSFNYGHIHFICVNSEISSGTELNVYGLSADKQMYSKKNIQEWCRKDIAKADAAGCIWKIAYCHEMPFTIMTLNVVQNYYWANKEDTSIERGGSRINTNSPDKYWFSQFCQNHDIRLVIGGHKHTQVTTWPLKENINPDGTVNSMKPIIQITAGELQSLYKCSSLYTETSGVLKGYSYPLSWKDQPSYEQRKHFCTFELVSKVTAPTYVMCQATGYKHTSNKELPAPNIPWLREYFPAQDIVITDQKTVSVKPNIAQKYPFYVIWKITPEKITGTIKKINYVFSSTGTFNINIKSSNPPEAIGGNGISNNGNNQIIIIK